MRDEWLHATLLVKSYYLFLLLVAGWAAIQIGHLVRLLILMQETKSDHLRGNAVAVLDQFNDPSAPAPGSVQLPVATQSPAIRVEMKDLGSQCDAILQTLSRLVRVTLIVSILSVVADALPALERESNDSSRPAWQSAYVVSQRLTTRLTMGLSVGAGLAAACTVFGYLSARRRLKWYAQTGFVEASTLRPGSDRNLD
jgi:hypothetical protein